MVYCEVAGVTICKNVTHGWLPVKREKRRGDRCDVIGKPAAGASHGNVNEDNFDVSYRRASRFCTPPDFESDPGPDLDET
jgi:hypothetical protein